MIQGEFRIEMGCEIRKHYRGVRNNVAGDIRMEGLGGSGELFIFFKKKKNMVLTK